MKQTASKAAPKVGLVSPGLPKGAGRSERIITQLRAEGYDAIARDYEGADV